MKKKIKNCIIAIMTLIPALSKAQKVTKFSIIGDKDDETKIVNPQSVVGKVFYHLSFVHDTTNRDSSINHEDFELDFGKNVSMFSSYSSRMRDTAMKKALEEQIKNIKADANGNQNININMTSFAPRPGESFSRDKFYTDIKDSGKSLRISNIVRSVFIISDTASKINWKILDSTKNIQGNLCQKAIGESHGRTYTAWFCSDIPYSFGPRRLNGLPGLILEAYDEKRDVIYTLDHIENNVTGEQIGLPEKGVPATQKEFAKAQEAFQKNPQAFLPGNISGSSGSKMQIKTVQGIAPKGFKRPVNNNPIDLK